MYKSNLLSIVSLFLLSVSAAPVADVVEKRAGACSSYTIINTRGTGELQGESAGFRTINSQIKQQLPGGKIYNTVYAADFSQNSALGTADIINHITSTLRTSPDECFVLQGYSQGAAATTNALPKITGANADAVKAVFLIGNPIHKPNLECNVDTNGGKSTANVSGLSAMLGQGIPQDWIAKTLDVCAYGDGVCDTTHGLGINAAHLSYPMSRSTQKLGVDFAVKQLNGA